MTEICRIASDEIGDLQVRIGSNSIFPLDKLRHYFTAGKIREILSCSCQKCRDDLRQVNSSADKEAYVHRILGGSDGNEPTKTSYAVFGLLVYIGYPMLIIGFLDHGCNDFFLESWKTSAFLFSHELFQQYTVNFSQDTISFARFRRKFREGLPRFAVPHIYRDNFSQYHAEVILPYIDEKEIGKREAENGRLTSEGANGKVFAFKILPEYHRISVWANSICSYYDADRSRD